MADFYDLWKGKSSIVDELRERLKEATDAYSLEQRSVIRIQKLFRGAFIRDKFAVKRAACVQITRLFRGHQSRLAFNKKAAALADMESMAVYHYHAVVIQRAFRGFYSRRYYHDYSARKKYIDSIREKGDNLRAHLAKHYEAQVAMEEQRIEEKAQAEFETVTANLHHLLSTKAMAGIYNSPYNPNGPVSVAGVPVEEHIQTGVMQKLREKGIQKKGLVVDSNGSRRIPVKPAKSRLSIQATSEYDAVQKEEKMVEKLSRLQFTGQKDFSSGHKVHELPYRRGLNEGSQYLEAWRNPYLMRGVPKNEAELKQGRTTLGKAPMVHFHTAVGGNMSTALPNDLFDVILDAEDSGGVCRRLKGKAARFGVPDTADVREESESVGMFPPLRSASAGSMTSPDNFDFRRQRSR
jgi:hypothetical protein